MFQFLAGAIPTLLILFVLVVVVLSSIRRVGPTEVGLVIKRWSLRKLSEDSPVAFHGEAGYQADLLMPGLRWKLWPLFGVENRPLVQVPAGEIGVVIAQVGGPLPIGAKSAVYRPEFGSFSDARAFVAAGGQKGVQRPVLPPGTLAAVHPVAFLVITRQAVYGIPVSPDLKDKADKHGRLSPEAFGLNPAQLSVVRIAPTTLPDGRVWDVIGVVTTFEGLPTAQGEMASRIGGFEDIAALEARGGDELQLIEAILNSKNVGHNSFQDFQVFLDQGGRIGLQHDPLVYGAYNLNPYLVSVEIKPMLVVQQGQVAVIKAFIGLPTEDKSGSDFKFGSLVRAGHRGIWQEPLRTGKYALNPRIYDAQIVPTYILTLNWASATSQAHDLDAQLSQIHGKSREGFDFSIDLQVQIHVPDVKAPRVISMVGTMANLVNEVLQPAVGNHFRNTLQGMLAVEFIESRERVQSEASDYITTHLQRYEVEVKGVYIQDVVLPQPLVEVLNKREIAAQQVKTYEMEKRAQDMRIETERSRGTADAQHELAASAVDVEVKRNNAQARKAEADGEATYLQQVGTAKGAEVRAVGLARAEGFEAQRKAIGDAGTTLVNVATVLADKGARFMPEILVNGGNGLDGLVAQLMGRLRSGSPPAAG
ncbi:MAG TPA: SPFH domain-containing protein [Candidatus Saccharimonadales bacterium]|nr:SPFH domain-containing protein [Candidatus Saccharimonadales bacterium]